MCQLYRWFIFTVTYSIAWAQTKSYINSTVVEEEPVDTYILSIPKLVGFYDNVGELKYSLSTSLDGEYFLVNKDTGVMKTKVRLDRESLCKNTNVKLCCNPKESDKCILQAQAIVQQGERTYPIDITITVKDKNDHTPTFDSDNPVIEINEEESPGFITHFPISDPDSYPHDVQVVRIEPLLASTTRERDDINKKFKVIKKRGGMDLLLLEKLDRENVEVYKMRLIAEDGGHIPRTGSCTLTVNVIDANDNVPQWVTTNFRLSLKENTPINQVILTLKAIDKDHESNSRITYLISPKFETANQHMFRINPSSGDLILSNRLDFDKQSMFEIPIIAKDSGKDREHTIQETVVIEVIDVNDHEPSISIISLMLDGSMSVKENLPPGQPVATVSVEDKDTGSGGEVQCIMISDQFQLEKVVHPLIKSYRLVTLVTFDREEKNIYTVIVSCSDNGSPKLTSQKPIRISIIDANDNPPRFSKEKFVVRIRENNNRGQLIDRINATDADEGVNSQIQFKLDERANYVSIDRNKGKLTANIVFDREKMSHYQFNVLAYDMGKFSSTSTCVVELIIEDDNDHSPRFNSSSQFSVPENSIMGTIVGSVTAVDDDEGKNAHVYYSFERTSREFRIDRNNGRITVAYGGLDRERQPSYTLKVIAEDNGIPRRSSKMDIYITLKDENDNPPEFIFPKRDNNYVNVSCSETPHFIIAKVTANDSDIDLNQKIEYSLIEQPGFTNIYSNKESADPKVNKRQYDIEANSGQIMLLQQLRDCNGQYEDRLVIRATDKGKAPLSATATLYIRFYDQPYRQPSDRAIGRQNGHLTAIIGLIVATTILIVLFCSILLLMRRRFIQEEKEYSPENHPMEGEDEKINQTMGGQDRPLDAPPYPDPHGFFYTSSNPDIYNYMETAKARGLSQRNKDNLYQTENISCHAMLSDEPYQLLQRAAYDTGRTYSDYNNLQSTGRIPPIKYTLLNRDGNNLPHDESEFSSLTNAKPYSQNFNTNKSPTKDSQKLFNFNAASNSVTNLKGLYNLESESSHGSIAGNATLPNKLKNPYCTVSFV